MRVLRRLRALAMLGGIFLYDLVASSWTVARIVLGRGGQQAPAIVVLPVDLRSRLGVAMFAHFVSLTPGSTCLHVSDDRHRLYVHLLDAPSEERAIARFKRLYESWLLELER